MKWIDSHCHLNYDYAPKSADDLVAEAHSAGVEALINIGVELGTQEAVVRISEQHPSVFHSAGIHPHEAQSLGKEEQSELRRWANHPKCRAIGEIGLDYYYSHSAPDLQMGALEYQLDLARELQLPVVIHSREGEAELLPKLAEYAKKCSHHPGVIHCFTGTSAFGRACLDLGFFISVSGILTFKNAHELRDAVLGFPLDRLLVETDSPYLAPVPMRGKKCEPSMVVHTGNFLAQLLNTPVEKVADVTTRNARQLFRL